MTHAVFHTMLRRAIRPLGEMMSRGRERLSRMRSANREVFRLLTPLCTLGAMSCLASCSDPTTTVPPHAGPVSHPTIFLTLSDSVAAAGTIVTVGIDARQPTMDSTTGIALPTTSTIAAFRARLAFSSSALEYVDEAPDGDGLRAVNVVDDTARIAGAAPGSGFTDGRLVTLRFRVIDPQGLRSIRLTMDELRDLTYKDRRAEFVGTDNSLARRRADVTPPPTASRVYGDATADGTIDMADVLAILTKDVGLATPTGFDSVAADVNTDNVVTTLDAQILLASFVGRDVIQFRLGDVVGSVPVIVTSIAPDTLTPGVSATITGTNFSAVAANDTVMIDTMPVVVTAASATQLTVTVPSSIPCSATHGALVAIRTGGATGARRQMLRVATPRSLQVGDSLVFDSDSAFRCNEFPAGIYFTAVYNSAREASPLPTSFQLISTSATTITGAPVTANRIPPSVIENLAPSGPPSSIRWTLLPGGDRARQRALAHLQFMARDAQRASQARFGPSRRTTTSNGRLRAALNVSSTLGAYSTVNFLGVTSGGDDTVITIRARTVYAGTRALILEDSLAPLSNEMDSYYQQLGSEFDNVMYAILTANFGNPLAMDANLSGTGRVTMLFTPMVTADYPGVEAFVTSCDFLTPADCPASNRTEMFYSAVPTRLTTTDGSDPNYDEQTPAGWYNEIRGTLIHETKHITALAEKFSRSTHPLLEESWLEEGTAQIASELYARSISGATWKGGATFQSALYCEIYLCPHYGFTMFDHFAWLYEYETGAETFSPIDPGVVDGTIYGSAWLLTRWAADAYASDEASFFKAIVQQTTVNGVSNLEARTGQPWNKMLGQWSLALAADHYGGVPHPPGFLSWNTRDVFGSLYQYMQGARSGYPLHIRQYFDPSLSISGTVAAGSAAFYDFVFGRKQSIGLRATATTDLPPTTTLRVAVVRME